MAGSLVNGNNIIPQCEFLDPLTKKPSRPWLVWLQNPSIVALNLANPLNIQSGGTGTSALPANGELLIGNNGSYLVNTLDQGDGIEIVNGPGSIEISNTGVLSITAGNGIIVDQPTGDVTISLDAQQENQTAISGQTIFVLTTMSYVPNSNTLSVFIDGVNQQLGTAFVETNSTTVTFTEGLHVGAKVRFVTV